MHPHRSTTLYCFSPPVMLATLLFEFGLALYVRMSFPRNRFMNLIVVVLLCLATFQLAEYHLCTDSITLAWTRLGIIAITFLPPLGLHLISFVTRKPGLAYGGYALATGFSALFLFVPGYVQGATCGGNYVILHTYPGWGWLYGLYYSGLLLFAVLQAAVELRRIKESPRTIESQLLLWLMIGYISFMGPMGVVYMVSEQSRHAVPSIMCGFAVILAAVLAFRVAPLYQRLPAKHHPKA